MFSNAATSLAVPGVENGPGITAPSTDAEWENVYKLCRLSEANISLDQFLSSPWNILREQGQEGAVDSIRRGFHPLLPAQAAIARRLREEEKERDHAAI